MKGVEAVVMGASAGGVQALLEILPYLPADYPVPVMTVLHIPADRANALVPLLRSKCEIGVKEAEDKESLAPGTVYFAPADYHLLVETDGSLALSSDEPVNFSRPSIDVLFESAADAYGEGLLAVLLTGANDDGARGLRDICATGGRVIVQDPEEAQARAMPEAGLRFCPTARVEKLRGIVEQMRAIEAP